MNKQPQETAIVLSPAQETALSALLAGKQHQEAAHAAGVRAEQVSRWLAEPVFLARYNAERVAIWAARRERLHGLTDLALTAVEETLQQSGPQRLHAALAILKLVEGMSAPHGPQTPEDVVIEQKQANDRRMLDAISIFS